MVQSYPARYGEVRGIAVPATAATGGIALTNAASFVQFPPGTSAMWFQSRNAGTGALTILYLLCPRLRILKTADAGATFTDYSTETQDGSTSTVATFSSLDTAANNDFIYVGSHIPFAGVHVVVTATNSNASVMTGKFWNGSTWTDISLTDGTINTGATLGQTGSITWTPSSSWVRADLRATGDTIVGPKESLYWARLQVSAALDASTTSSSMTGISRQTVFSEQIIGVDSVPISVDDAVVSGVMMKTDQGTANVIVNAGAQTFFAV